MDSLVTVLFWLHLAALALGGAASFGIPVVGSRIAGASVETRPMLFGLTESLSNLGKAAIAILIVTGPLLVWLRFGGVSGFSHWFWVKMVLLVLLLVTIIFAGIIEKRAAKGDLTLLPRVRLLGAASSGLFLLVILSAVLTFG
jgi:putative membrane protein